MHPHDLLCQGRSAALHRDQPVAVMLDGLLNIAVRVDVEYQVSLRMTLVLRSGATRAALPLGR